MMPASTQERKALEILKEKNIEPRTLHLVKPPIKNRSKIKIFLRNAKTQSLLPTYLSEEGI